MRGFLIDGFVAGFWTIAQDGMRAALLLEPFRKLAKKDEAAPAAEARRLLELAAPGREKGEVRFA